MARSKAFQVNLEPEQHRRLQRLAGHRGRSMGSLVRESVAAYLTGLPADEDPLAEVVGMFEDAEPRPFGDVAEEHDRYLSSGNSAIPAKRRRDAKASGDPP
jgi:hypothetical protein